MDDIIIIEKNQVCVARDGTTLYCDIYRPNDDGKYPILINRFLDGKDSNQYHYLDLHAMVLEAMSFSFKMYAADTNPKGPFIHYATNKKMDTTRLNGLLLFPFPMER